MSAAGADVFITLGRSCAATIDLQGGATRADLKCFANAIRENPYVEDQRKKSGRLEPDLMAVCKCSGCRQMREGNSRIPKPRLQAGSQMDSRDRG